MDKENLFEDIGLGDARERLQEVSKYMDKVIRRRRMRAEWDRKDVTKDDMWNLAHDVLEIIHCPESKSIKGLTLAINVDTTELDEAIKKAEHLAELISENAFDPVEFYGWNKQDLILVLVNNYAWSYTDACNFAESYWDRR